MPAADDLRIRPRLVHRMAGGYQGGTAGEGKGLYPDQHQQDDPDIQGSHRRQDRIHPGCRLLPGGSGSA